MVTYILLLHNNKVQITLLDLKKILSKEKKRCRWKSTESRYSVMQIMTVKTTIVRTLYVHVGLNSAIFP